VSRACAAARRRRARRDGVGRVCGDRSLFLTDSRVDGALEVCPAAAPCRERGRRSLTVRRPRLTIGRGRGR
jgi:hypothetical protein